MRTTRHAPATTIDAKRLANVTARLALHGIELAPLAAGGYVAKRWGGLSRELLTLAAAEVLAATVTRAH
ncbi:MAG: hypothetical protein ACTHL8_05420 [Burkholderiaceae bacterium]